jgi:hypothetical protein
MKESYTLLMNTSILKRKIPILDPCGTSQDVKMKRSQKSDQKTGKIDTEPIGTTTEKPKNTSLQIS